ncbi:kinetochore protein NUF2 homolog isoform X2 [Aristolochia californica]|uniref:kinetochore protein NUF2 homolog isoform X2 n=1 Tax=Aristolochia californica TaxID=171875 RepID=UPI0035D7EB5D
MSAYSFPSLPPGEIISVLSEWEMANVTMEDLKNPTLEFVCSLYSVFLASIDPLGDDPQQVGFGSLDLLENPEAHTSSVQIVNLYVKMKELICFTCMTNFTMGDLLRPKRDRTVTFISGIINFLLFREERLNLVRPIVDKVNLLEERRIELETKKSELMLNISEHEMRSKMEQPMVNELQAEVKELQQSIQNLNKQQMSIRASCQKLKDKTKEIDVKISGAELKLVESAQENNRLRSKIVQSPEKLQGALEEKKLNRAEMQHSERLAMESVQEKSSDIEVYTKAATKLSKHLRKMQSLQEQVNSAKTVDKDIKDLKAKLSDEGRLDMSVEAKIAEHEHKAEQAIESEKATKMERDLKHREALKELSDVKSDMEAKLRELDLREMKIRDMVAEVDSINLKKSAIREAGLAKQQKIYIQGEEILSEVRNYSKSIDDVLLKIELERLAGVSNDHFVQH